MFADLDTAISLGATRKYKFSPRKTFSPDSPNFSGFFDAKIYYRTEAGEECSRENFSRAINYISKRSIPSGKVSFIIFGSASIDGLIGRPLLPF